MTTRNKSAAAMDGSHSSGIAEDYASKFQHSEDSAGALSCQETTDAIRASNRLPELAASISAAHANVQKSAEQMAEQAIAAGRLLIEAKASVGHGGWLPWLKENVGISERTARRYMQLANAGIKSATVADLGIVGAVARAQAIAAVPLPETGKCLLCVQADESGFFFVWNEADKNGEFLHHAFVYEDAIIGTHKGWRRDNFIKLLQKSDDGRFDYAGAEYIQCDPSKHRQLLDELHDGFLEAEVDSWPKNPEAHK